MRKLFLCGLSSSLSVGLALAAAGCSGAGPGQTTADPAHTSAEAVSAREAYETTGTSRARPGPALRARSPLANPTLPSALGKRVPEAHRIAEISAGEAAAASARIATLAQADSRRAPEQADPLSVWAPGERAPVPVADPIAGATFHTDGLNLPHCNYPQHLICNASGCFCGPPPVHESVNPDPWFQVVNIQYSLPGSMSEVDYTAGSYIGSQTSYQHVASIGIDAQATWPTGSSIENKFTVGHISGSANSLQVTSSSGVAIMTNMTDDVVHHEKDIFAIWVNSLIQITTINGVFTGLLVTANGTPIVETVTAGQLLGLVPIESWKRLSALTPAQKQRILAMDPFFSPSGFNPGSTRFEYETSLELDGPPPGGNFVAHTYDLQTNLSNSSSSGIQITDELTADFGFSSLFKAGIDLQYQYQEITTTMNGTIADASLKIGSTNQCVHVGVDVYKDKSFGTFITVPTTTDMTGAQSGWDCCNSNHSVCAEGDPLDATCTANSCLQTVCASDPFCCASTWDSICVSEANAWCSPAVCGNPL